jgi:carboxypeptidase C (cathepsin A)
MAVWFRATPHPRIVIMLVACSLLAFLIVADARAQDAATPPQTAAAATGQAPDRPPTGPGARGNAATPPAAAEQHRLPGDSTTKHTLTLPGRSLAFTATAGSIRLFDDKGEPQADIAYISYQLDGAEPRSRPVTFVFNGGPGASSAWLQLGNAGPWRLPLNGDAAIPSALPELQPNAETWLDFTDLVFIDPVGTGYSRFVATGEDVRKRFYSVEGDIASIAVTIRRWLEKSDRLLSPKFVLGESYGGIRGPRVVRELQTRQGIGVKGLILISPLFDFREYSGSSLLQYVASLPTMAAVAREAKAAVARADLADVENYARGDFLSDLIKGEADAEATTRLADRVAALTGIDRAVSRRLAGRFDISEFRREFARHDGKVTGRYDASVLGQDPNPDSSFHHFDDPSGEALLAPLQGQAQLAAGRALRTLERRGQQGLGFRTRPGAGAIDLAAPTNSRPRPQAEGAGGARAVRSRHALFRLEDPARSIAALCDARSRQARGLSGRPHVLHPRRFAPGAARRSGEHDEVKRDILGKLSLHPARRGDDEAKLAVPSYAGGTWIHRAKAMRGVEDMKRTLGLAVIAALIGGTALGNAQSLPSYMEPIAGLATATPADIATREWPTLITPGPGAASIADLK